MQHKRNILIFILIFLLFLITKPVSAQLAMVPLIKEVVISPGGQKSFYLSVLNTSDKTSSSKMHAKDMGVTPEGVLFPARKEMPRGCSKWVKFSPESFKLEPKRSQKIRCTLTCPRSNIQGGYYALLACSYDPETPSPTIRPTGEIRIRPHVASALLVTVKGRNLYSKIDLSDLKFYPRVSSLKTKTKKSGWQVEVAVENTGNLHAVFTGSVNIRSQNGRLIGEAPLVAGRGYVMPEQKRIFTAKGRNRLPDGLYLVTTKVKPLERGRYNKPAIAMSTFSVIRGEAKAIKPTPEMLAQTEALSPGFIVNSSGINLTIPGGARRTQVLQITNITKRPLDIVAMVRDWDEDEKGKVIFPEDPKHNRSGCTYVKISLQKLRLPPNGRARFMVTLSMPRQAKGEYYAAVIFKRNELKLPDDPDFILPISVLISTLATRTEQYNAEVREFQIVASELGGYIFKVKVKNLGNTRCYTEGAVSVRDDESKLVESLLFGDEKMMVLPGNERLFTIEWPRVLESGNYRAELTLRYNEKSKALFKQVSFKVE